jgi:ubiquinone/menaquinone biosynthesis C-methylase UbiE
MINIVKKYAHEITGVDVTQAMMDKVDKSGTAKIDLINSDTGSVTLPKEHYDLATAYTFLDHLYDMEPTFVNTFNALKAGGRFYADLSPNFYFWDSVKKVDSSQQYDPILQREINAVLSKDEEIQAQFGIEKETFRNAEHQKHIKGGLVEEELRSLLLKVGFKDVQFIYHWFIGQAQLINDQSKDKTIRFEQATVMHDYLVRSLPISRNLFKYIGFIAIK